MRTICIVLTISWMTAALAFLQAATAIIPLDTFSSTTDDIDRRIEARLPEDVAADNEIALAVKRMMTTYGTITATVEVHEQRLLVTGLFNDRRLYDRFRRDLQTISGVKKLYWHVQLRPDGEKARNARRPLDWGDALVLEGKAAAILAATRAVADINYRIASDAHGTVYVMGRARSAPELKTAIDALRETEGLNALIQYVTVRP